MSCGEMWKMPNGQVDLRHSLFKILGLEIYFFTLSPTKPRLYLFNQKYTKNRNIVK